MAYFTPEEIQQAKQLDLLAYLQIYEPDQLVKVSGDTYCTKEHDSLKISNGKWHWFSRQIGGKTALDYLVKVRGCSFLEAMEIIQGKPLPKAIPAPAPKQEPKRLLLPERNDNADTVIRYLKGRGIHDVILRYCLENDLLFESRKYHSAVFLGYDKEGVPRYGNVRGTVGDYKGELSGSDKHYSFSIPGNSQTVHVFESAIDALSYATLELFEGKNWHEDHLLSLAGVMLSNLLSDRRREAAQKIAQAVTDARLEELTREVRLHNNFARRMPVVEEQIKILQHSLEKLEKER